MRRNQYNRQEDQEAEQVRRNFVEEDNHNKFKKPTPQASEFSILCSQVWLMMKKNFIIYKRNYKQSLFLLLSPVMIFILITCQQYIANKSVTVKIIDPPIENVPLIRKCMPPKGGSTNDCLTIGYGVVGQNEAWIDYVMDYVANVNKLEFGKDVKQISQGKVSDFMGYLTQNPNKTQIGVIFCTEVWDIYEKVSVPCKFEKKKNNKLIMYSVVYNWTLDFTSPYLSDQNANWDKNNLVLKLKLSIDNAIAQLFEEYQNISETLSTTKQLRPLKYEEKISITQQDYPILTNRYVSGFDATTGAGAFYYFIPIMMYFITTVNEILYEKEKKLRQGIQVMGLKDSAYWISWFLTVLIGQAMLTIVFLLFGTLVFQLDFFTNSPTIVQFIFYLTFGISQQIIGFFITTICPSGQTGQSVSYGFLLLAIVMELFMSSGWLIKYLYEDKAKLSQKILLAICLMYPPFHYTKIYNDITTKTNRYFSTEQGAWIQGKNFHYKDIFEKNSKVKLFWKQGHTYSLPSPLENWLQICGNTLIFYILVWYFDHTLQNNGGTTYGPLFFLTRDYWKCKKEKKTGRKFSIQEAQPYDYQELNKLDSVKVERQRVYSNYKYNTEAKGIRIVKLCKVYSKYPFGIKSVKDVEALKDIFLEVEENELLGLLGHNGAGKSTIINILTGQLSLSKGSVQIYGYDIQQSIGDIRQILGVCPQFDILWNELTAEEHLKMFCQLKKIPKEQIDREIAIRMAEVSLSHVKKQQIRTYSGGMKRRISLAISSIGDPKIILLDEPTSGLDPKTKNQIWRMIQQLKQKRSMILTTHSMEEAEALSDRITIINQGEVRCIGTPIFLKTNYGDGYRLTIICNSQCMEQVRSQLRELMHSSKVVGESGDRLIITVPLDKNQEIKTFFKVMESQKASELKSMILEWGISHTTLEEIFLKITNS